MLIVGLVLVAFFGAYRFASARQRQQPQGSAAQTAPVDRMPQRRSAATAAAGAAGASGAPLPVPRCACCGSGAPTENGVTGALTKGAAVVEGGVQKIAVDVTTVYNPNTIKLKAGVPAEITFSQAQGCTQVVQSADLGFTEDLSAGPKTVKLKGLQPGTYAFSCGMQMVFGTDRRRVRAGEESHVRQQFERSHQAARRWDALPLVRAEAHRMAQRHPRRAERGAELRRKPRDDSRERRRGGRRDAQGDRVRGIHTWRPVVADSDTDSAIVEMPIEAERSDEAIAKALAEAVASVTAAGTVQLGMDIGDVRTCRRPVAEPAAPPMPQPRSPMPAPVPTPMPVLTPEPAIARDRARARAGT